tara:strand:- start:69543 stop:70478 length:936 start_codon:yes stop_codon:yes gene_type:complete
MKIVLAPMEGVIDFAMREILTSGGSYTYGLTEFMRVNDHLLSKSQFTKYAPELLMDGRTRSGTPIYIQLLGQEKNWMAENAYRAWEMGALGVDLNFGCPAKTVNKHKGGSILLKEPDVVHAIVKDVRKAVPVETPVTVKMRLGYGDKSLAIENAKAIEEAGATSLAVHARTKLEGYKPPAHWHWIAKIKEQVAIPIIANGDIWSKRDALNCMAETGCEIIMIGRGALSLPNLADTISANDRPYNWQQTCRAIREYAEHRRDQGNQNFIPNRIKQWLSYLKREYTEADDLFTEIKRLRELGGIIDIINRKYL